MFFSSINNVNTYQKCTFKGNEKKDSRISVPVSSECDVFAYSGGVAQPPFMIGKIAGKIFEKVKQAGQNAIEKVNNVDVQQAINTVKLTKMFVDNKTFLSYREALEHKEEIEELAKLDFNTVEKKYNTLIANYKIEGETPEKNAGSYYTDMSIYRVKGILSYEKLTKEDIDEIFRLRRNRSVDSNSEKLDVFFFYRTLKDYDNFDNLSALSQKSFIDTCEWSFACPQTLQKDEAESISDYSPLMKFEYIRDLKQAGSKEEFVENLNERRKNIPCKPIETDKEIINALTSEKGLSELNSALNKTDLTKYEKGFPLSYSREDFIKDFNKLTRGLSPKDKTEIYKHFGFKINSDNDIENYPNPQAGKIENPELSKVSEKCRECINKFMLENKVCLNPEDKDLEDVLNNLIKAYPEFISIMGKIQHRGDSIDFHTFDDLKQIMNNPRYDELPPQEQRIITIATLFHDFGKAQGVLDDGHAQKSAQAVKEIIKKTEFSFDEKERIYNLVKHSHWLTDGSANDDLGFYFRRPNDFKMAQIFEKADTISSGYEYFPETKKIEEINSNINKINSNGIPVFADSLPRDISKYDVNKNGVRYIDLRDPEASVEKYGYPKGTKVKDLKFLCHASSDNIDDFSILCDDSKDVCLSTMLLDRSSSYTTGYNSQGAYILSGNNANIVLGAKNLSCTGGGRGYFYAKESMYQRMENLQQNGCGFLNNNFAREEIPNKIRESLDLTKDEYTELYNSVCNLEKADDIDDVQLSSGRKLSKEDIKKTINSIKDEMVKKKDPKDGGYTNEFVVYNPKIEGMVVHGDIDRYRGIDIPLVLV